MERKNEVVKKESTLPRWKKIGGGSLRLRGRIIKPGQTFQAAIEDIPNAFRKSLICLDEDVMVMKANKKIEEIKEAEEVYFLVEREDSKGWWDVVNTGTKKKQNGRALRKDEAEELLNTLKK